MKIQNQFIGFISFIVILICFTQCSSAQKLQEKASFELGQVTFQKWVAGIQGGGSGYHMLIHVVSNKNNVAFDSIYFRGYRAKIDIEKINYVAYIKTETNQRKDIIMSNNGNDEFGNKSPLKESDFPFKLADNECVISYIENKTTKYIKVKNLIENPMEEYPSAPPKQP
jgi:hypothetical protein